MNNKIQFFIEQATKRRISHGETTEYFDQEAFAYLIVYDITKQIIDAGTGRMDFDPSQTGVRDEFWNLAQDIKKQYSFNAIVRGDRVKIISGFSVGSVGTVEFVEPRGNIWVLRDGASDPVWYHREELAYES